MEHDSQENQFQQYSAKQRAQSRADASNSLNAVHLPPPGLEYRKPLEDNRMFPTPDGREVYDEWSYAQKYYMPYMPTPQTERRPQSQQMAPQAPPEAHAPAQLPANSPVMQVELIDDGKKPPFSYAMLIGMAILRSPKQRLTLAQIYQWINDTFSYYRKSQSGWQNSIRHNLSLSKAFIKQHRPKNDPGKGNYWCVAPGYEHQFYNPTKRQQRTDVKQSTFQHQLPVAPVMEPIISQQPVPSGSQPLPHQSVRTASLSGLSPSAGAGPTSGLFINEARSRSQPDLSAHAESSPAAPRIGSGQSPPQQRFLGPSPAKRPAPSPLGSSAKRLMSDMPSLQPPPTVWMPQVHAAAQIAWDLPSAGSSPQAGSPVRSLQQHRNYINQLCNPIYDDSCFEGPASSPQRLPDARRRLFCEPSYSAASAPSQNLIVDEHIADIFEVSPVHVRQQYDPSGHPKPMFTPIRRPFDTPIRDQSYSFSPDKPAYGAGHDGSPMRRR